MAGEGLPILISELMANECDGDRLRTKDQFMEKFQILDAKLNQHVWMNADNLSTILTNTSKAVEKVTDAKVKCQSLKSRILKAKELLQCKRDEIRNMWIDSLEHTYVYKMLAEIHKLNKVPDKVDKYLHDKQYVQATQILMSSISLAEGDFKDVDALSNLRVELNGLKNKLYLIFSEELRQELYWSSFRRVYDTSRGITDENLTYEKMFRDRNLGGKDVKICLNGSYVKVLLECVVLLQKCPETLESLKEDCQNELLLMVQKLSKFMSDVILKLAEQPVLELPEERQFDFLIDLLQTIFSHFRYIASNYKEFLYILDDVVPNDRSNMHLVHVYACIQNVVEQFVCKYLEQQPLTNLTSLLKVTVFSSTQNLNDVSSYFEPHVARECPTLFKFSNSLSGMRRNIKTADEQALKNNENNFDSTLRYLAMVCKPAVRNITVIYAAMKQFADEIESLLSVEYGGRCPLNNFICDAVHALLDQVSSEVNKILDNASVNLESWIMCTSPNEELDSEKKIFTSTLVLNNNLKELQTLIEKLPDYSNHFLHLIYYVTLDYKDMLQKAFKVLFGEEHNILSVSWAKDRDIRRLLKSFSNWKHLEDNKVVGDGIPFPEEVRLRNKEESQLLIRNLHNEEHGSWAIISDYNILLNLAVLQESSQWFSVQLLNFIDDIVINCENGVISTSNSLTGLKKLVKEYEDFADVSLLALHLEVRAHCFHFLLPPPDLEVTFDTYIGQNFESSVRQLVADLTKIDETVHPILTSKELKYIFEGVGELVAAILIQNISNVIVPSESVIKRFNRSIFSIQCCLSSITLAREVALEKARHYAQLLSFTCDDILNEVMEDGPIFSEAEYASLLRIISKKNSFSDDALNNYVLKLKKIFKTVSVTI